MSYHHTIACLACEEEGPILRQGAGGLMFAARNGDRLEVGEAGRSVWSEWLSEHRYHDLTILGETESPPWST